MNLDKLFPIQKQFDDHIVKEHNLYGQDLIKKKTVAAINELHECVNEARFFKFWSKNQSPRVIEYKGAESRNPLLEEYVDTVHFTLSLANDINYTQHKYSDPGTMDLNDLTIGLTSLISMIPYFSEPSRTKNMENIFNYLIKFGYQLDFTEEQVIKAYIDKNKVNYERQAIGY